MTVQEVINYLLAAEDKSQQVEVFWEGLNCGIVASVKQSVKRKVVVLQTIIPDPQ